MKLFALIWVLTFLILVIPAMRLDHRNYINKSINNVFLDIVVETDKVSLNFKNLEASIKAVSKFIDSQKQKEYNESSRS